MSKIYLFLSLFIFPLLCLAEDSGSLSFAPPPGDYSVVLLGNLFGVVDGVLHGSGSQIMGNIFGVFNAAVLALGGIIITYTLLVSTMNTAHEGQMLGQQWSSIWIPIRATGGLALLIPKTSGYCMMQIFVMWVIVQGVGAADKVWSAALGYLNQGGVIIHENLEPERSFAANEYDIANGAVQMLTGQVCMLGVQSVLQSQLASLQQAKQYGVGPCASPDSQTMEEICSATVPDFINTFNAVTAQSNAGTSATSVTVSMPNFDGSSPFYDFNGLCGQITWNVMTQEDADRVATQTTESAVGSTTQQNTAIIQQTRSIAVQQMYSDLSQLARTMVNNNPQLSSNPSNNNTEEDVVSSVASSQYGVPLQENGQICETTQGGGCTGWGSSPNYSSAPLFNGTEFQGAISDYNTIMEPTLKLQSQSNGVDNQNNERKFIAKAETSGWLMAGSYYFDLVKLNGSASSQQDTDTNSGLKNSSATVSQLNCSSNNGNLLCQLLNGDSSQLDPIVTMVNGRGNENVPAKQPSFNGTSALSLQDESASSTVYGFINNSAMVKLPDQQGVTPPSFPFSWHPSMDVKQYYLPNVDIGCRGWLCIPGVVGDVIYNYVIVLVFNIFLGLVNQIIDQLVQTILIVPLMIAFSIFKKGIAIIEQPGVNPIVALAKMGSTFINQSFAIGLEMIEMAVLISVIPEVGPWISVLLSMAAPVLICWLGIMVGTGMFTAYYIPFLPYMIFTLGSFAWFMVVIEAMVAAPIVALGVTHPEGHQAFGKSEAAIMILMNVFLRPSMMIIGYISAIALTYVGVWLINKGFSNVLATSNINNYTDWASMFAMMFSILFYTMLYLTLVQKSFSLVATLPDKVLRWIGGQPEGVGQEAMGWGDEVKGKMQEAGQKTLAAATQAAGAVTEKAASEISKAHKKRKKNKKAESAKLEAGQESSGKKSQGEKGGQRGADDSGGDSGSDSGDDSGDDSGGDSGDDSGGGSSGD